MMAGNGRTVAIQSDRAIVRNGSSFAIRCLNRHSHQPASYCHPLPDFLDSSIGVTISGLFARVVSFGKRLARHDAGRPIPTGFFFPSIRQQYEISKIFPILPLPRPGRHYRAGRVGISPRDDGDAVKAARTPMLDKLMTNFPMTKLLAHGKAVGMPSDEDMGNSEVGHNAIGAGRVFAQGAKLVAESIASAICGKATLGRKWSPPPNRAARCTFWGCFPTATCIPISTI